MVRIDRVVTRGGDGGHTSLGDGTRVAKSSLRIGALGSVDELNAVIGVIRLHADCESDAQLARVQNDLFDVGADLAVPGEMGERLRLTEAPIERLEAEVAQMNNHIAPLKSFILPGGSPASAYAHLGRTIARRAEREVAMLAESEVINPQLLRFLNRLSDYLFVLARRYNQNGHADLLWQPGANRT